MKKNKINQNLISFLNNKELFYDKIDYSIVSKAWDILRPHIDLPFVIHIVGTNGKGSTGRFLASFLYQQNFNILHFSSPHIINFNERIWINNDNCKDSVLDKSHQKLLTILPNNIVHALTYFEYSTLLALLLSDGFDYIVLEAGLGGEFDATNVVKNDLTLITTIGLDHIEFLGDTINKIATTKMRSCDKKYILGKQIFNEEVLIAKKEVLNQKEEVKYLDIDLNKAKKNILDKNNKKLPKYLEDNLELALKTIIYLYPTPNSQLPILNFKLPTLFGRCQQLTPNITIDVGHNSLAATVLLKEFSNSKVVLIYNSYKDKDYQKVLEILNPIISELQIIDIIDERIVKKNDLISLCDTLSISVKEYDKIESNKKYLVFGSFKVVEKFLEGINIEF